MVACDDIDLLADVVSRIELTVPRLLLATVSFGADFGELDSFADTFGEMLAFVVLGCELLLVAEETAVDPRLRLAVS